MLFSFNIIIGEKVTNIFIQTNNSINSGKLLDILIWYSLFPDFSLYLFLR